MNCQKFREVLPYIIESGGNEEEEGHLRTCPHCAELVQDLESIATQAKLLLPMYDPSPRVWTGIEQGLRFQGLIPEGRMSPRGHVMSFPAPAKSWTPFGLATAVLALAGFFLLLINYHPHWPQPQPAVQNASIQPAALPGPDQQLILGVSRQAPDVGRAYEVSLRDVDTYITDAQEAVDHDPQDEVAREQLMNAYQQKQMLYEMATARTLP